VWHAAEAVTTRSSLADTLVDADPRVTIRPASLGSTVRIADSAQPTGDEPVLAELAPRFVIGTTIGEGGMAIVRAATQTSLGREVAVKTSRPGAPLQAAAGLLREAWITGALEHPNIVPIHDLGTDDTGRPMLVLKRIEGRPWSALLHKPAEIRADFGADALEWNLQQLIRVCHAISFAHARGIVHRDLKPANVMIGRFDEVYVVDWGIAVSLVDDGRLPFAGNNRELAGTPAYMAPEMLGDAPATERTDVYLLGAIAFEIVTGAPPHVGATAFEALASVAASDRAFPVDAPDELVAICRRAMANDPAARFPSAAALRVALVRFLEHRGSAVLAREAAERLGTLEATLDTPDFDRATAYQQLGQCRFGFEAALRAWPANAGARAGLDRAFAAMAAYELGHGDARAASVLLAELREPPPALVARLAELERAAADKAKRVEQLERLGADHNAAFGGAARALFLVLFGLSWSVIVGANAFPALGLSHPTALAVSSGSALAMAGYTWFARRAMTATALNRGVIATAFIGIATYAVIEAIAWWLGLDMVTTHTIAAAAWVGACSTAAVFLDRALVVPTLGFLSTLVVCLVAPAHRQWMIAASEGVLLMTAGYVLTGGKRGRPISGLADLLRTDRT
jgi:eukaryotic-like serine/threonine-protein kinase